MHLGRRRTKKVILYLSTGDVCRGPMAQGYTRHALQEKSLGHVEVRTAGVMTVPGIKPSMEAIAVMTNAGIDIKAHRSSPMTPELIRKADLVLGMSPFHVQEALKLVPEAKGRVFLLKEFAEGSEVKNYQITDPMGATLEVYKRVYREMKLAVDKMLEKDFFQVKQEEKSRIRSPKQLALAAAQAAAKAAAPAKPAPAAKGSAPAKGKAAAPAAPPAKGKAAPPPPPAAKKKPTPPPPPAKKK